MKEFEVVLKQKVEYEVSIYVEAESKEDAIRKAEHLQDDDISVSEMEDCIVGFVYEKEFSC